MDDLVRFVTACLDEDQQLAEDAIALPGTRGQWSYVETRGGEHKVVDSLGYTVTGHYDVDAQPYFCEPHIARHDPARVLREIDAKRRIIALWAASDEDAAGEQRYADSYETGADGWPMGREDALSDTLRLLAQPYSDRPGYREEWAP